MCIECGDKKNRNNQLKLSMNKLFLFVSGGLCAGLWLTIKDRQHWKWKFFFCFYENIQNVYWTADNHKLHKNKQIKSNERRNKRIKKNKLTNQIK